MFRQPSPWIFVLLPNVISDFFVNCLGHDRAYRIRSFCRHSNGYLLRIGTPSPFLHPSIRILLCSWLYLWLPARCVAVRIGGTGVVGHCSGKVVVRAETENRALRVDERNRDIRQLAYLRFLAAAALPARSFVTAPNHEGWGSVCRGRRKAKAAARHPKA